MKKTHQQQQVNIKKQHKSETNTNYKQTKQHKTKHKNIDICKRPQNIKESSETCASAQARNSQTLRRGRTHKLRHCI